ncbi:MAG: hypothetical protein CMH31_02900 [Micavibrio sp.]|nr:hypothetical protein [Micavibrio sp.]|tara:strand:- start:1225 stop:1584 length:360 start_codon:yes stop_codon:yes gene_type:complete
MDHITHQHFVMPIDKPDKVSEYSIYTYKNYDDEKFGFNKWQRYKTVSGLNRAMKEAKVLHRSRKFQKIEVKQKYFDESANRSFSKTLKVFQNEPINWQKLIVNLVMGLSVLTLFITVLQ